MEIIKAEYKLNDRELIAGCREQNRLVQRALYKQYNVALYTLIFRIVNEKETSNDLLQETFIEIFSSIDNFSFKSSLYSWMRTIALRTTMAHLKKQAKLEIVYQENEKIYENIESKGSYNFTAKHLETAIATLPEKARIVFVLCEIEGYKHKEIGELIGINEGTSKSQLNYAKKLLRAKLKQTHE